MKLSSFLSAAGLLFTLSVAVPTATPTVAEMNAVPVAHPPTAAPTLMPRDYHFDVEEYCRMLSAGQYYAITFDPAKTYIHYRGPPPTMVEIHAKRTLTHAERAPSTTAAPRIMPRGDVEDICSMLRAGEMIEAFRTPGVPIYYPTERA